MEDLGCGCGSGYSGGGQKGSYRCVEVESRGTQIPGAGSTLRPNSMRGRQIFWVIGM